MPVQRYRLALLARRADRIKALADELGSGSIAIEADVTDHSSIVRAAGRVQAELGGTDVLVNNAGIMLLAPFTDRSLSARPTGGNRRSETDLSRRFIPFTGYQGSALGPGTQSAGRSGLK